MYRSGKRTGAMLFRKPILHLGIDTNCLIHTVEIGLEDDGSLSTISELLSSFV